MLKKQGIKKENGFWKDIIVSLLIVFASFLGQIPLGIAILLKSLKEEKFHRQMKK